MLIFIFSLINILKAQQQFYSKVYFDISGSAQAYSLVKSNGNAYLIAGDKDNAAFIMKVDTVGNIIWKNTYSNGNGGRFNQIISINDSNFFAVGSSYNTVSGNMDALCVKIDSNGTVLWSKLLDLGDDDIAYSVQQTYNMGYIIVGNTYNSSYSFVTRLDSIGNLLWSEKINSVNPIYTLYSVKESQDSGYVVIGNVYFGQPLYSYQVVLIKLAQNGTISWSKMTQIPNSFNTSGLDIMNTQNGYMVYMSKDFSSIDILNTDLLGNVLWSKEYLYVNNFNIYQGLPAPRMKIATDGCYLITSSSQWNSGSIFLKIDSVGNPLLYEYLLLLTSDIIETLDKGCLAIGNGPLYGVKQPPTSNPQIGIVKMDSIGNSNMCNYQYVCDYLNDTINLYPISINTVPAGSLITNSEVPFVTSLDVVDYECVFFYGGIDDLKNNTDEIEIFPNPTNGDFSIRTENFEIEKVEVYNVYGKLVFETSEQSIIQNQIDLSFCSDGIYFLKVSNSFDSKSRKIVICH